MIAFDFSTHLSVFQSGTPEKLRVYGIPTQRRTVVIVNQAVFNVAFREQSRLQLWGGSQEPAVDRPNVNRGLTAFEIIDVGVSVLSDGAAVSRDQVRRFSGNVNTRSGRRFVKRQRIDEFGQKLALSLVLEVRSNNGIVNRLVADVDLLGQRPFTQIEHGCSHTEPVA